MTADTYREIQRVLLERQERLARRLSAIRADLATPGAPPAGDWESGASALGGIVEAASQELALIAEALARMTRGEFGRCAKCGGTVGLTRLQFLPYAARCESCAPGLDLDSIRQLRVEHLGLRQLVSALRSAFEEHSAAGSGGVPDAPLMALLGDLARELPEHFAREERGGYLADVLAIAPRLSHRAAALQTDHAELLESALLLQDRAREATGAPGAWALVEAEFSKLAARLLEHEDAEGALVREAFATDVSPSD